MSPVDEAAIAFLNSQTAGLSERDALLLRTAVATLERNTVGPDGMLWAPHRGIIPAFGTYEGVWNWDAAFHAIAVSRWNPALAWEQLYIFLDNQKEDGGFIDVLFSNGEKVTDFGKPPVWPWAVRLMEERAPGAGYLSKAFEAFERLYDHWSRKRQRDGLFHYDTAGRDGDWLQQVKYESGWDNSVRFDEGIVELWPPDLNGYMVLFVEAMTWFAEKLDRDPGPWVAERARLEAEIEARLWSRELGAYCDYDCRRRKFTGVLTPASFVPLFAGASSQDAADGMARLAADSEKFFPGMPTVAYDNPGYSRDMWRGPCWLNTAYFAVKGLRRYGHKDVAGQIRETILDWCAAENQLREYYDAKTGEGLAAVGFGWTAAFVIELILDW